jgi:hypothetical protein
MGFRSESLAHDRNHAGRRLMRKLGPVIMGALTTTALVVGASTALAAHAESTGQDGQGLHGTFKVHFPKGHPASNAPCPPDEFCGVGRVVGFGESTITITDETFDEIDDSPCFAVTREEEIAPTSGVGTLVIDSSGTFCRPGRSGDSHASPSSYGGPGRWDLRYTVDETDSSGVFAGATGGGTERASSNGGVGVWHIRGSLSLT